MSAKLPHMFFWIYGHRRFLSSLNLAGRPGQLVFLVYKLISKNTSMLQGGNLYLYLQGRQVPLVRAYSVSGGRGARREDARSGSTTDPRTGPSRAGSTTSQTSTLRSKLHQFLFFSKWGIFRLCFYFIYVIQREMHAPGSGDLNARSAAGKNAFSDVLFPNI
jgi:hypothetical protein